MKPGVFTKSYGKKDETNETWLLKSTKLVRKSGKLGVENDMS